VFLQEIIPFNGSTEENGVKGDSTLEKLAKLKPAFVKPHGTHTAANSSFLSDGASAALITSEAKAKELGLTPRSTFKVH
jgi:acetyl-CoA acyltransferase